MTKRKGLVVGDMKAWTPTLSRLACRAEGGAVGVRGQGQPLEGLECQTGVDHPLRAIGRRISAWLFRPWSVSQGCAGLEACKIMGGPLQHSSQLLLEAFHDFMK